MDEQQFMQVIFNKAKAVNINPILLLSGIEGIYTFKDMPLNQINFDLLDSLIITILTLRIGDQFHALAEENLNSTNTDVQVAAINELMELTPAVIEASSNRFLQSFAQMVHGKTTIRRYHEKALEADALEVQKAQQHFAEKSIGLISLNICKSEEGGVLDLSAIFGNA
ncbi:MAG TPA: hypothetical protein VEY32_13515 [Flavisolibacter sp.]|nr:hypothetical protein [Flavisolibacter sp.]